MYNSTTRMAALLAVVLPSTSLAGDARTPSIELHVQDAAGAPIRHATFRFPVEGASPHIVNDYTGKATLTELYDPDGGPILLRKGQVYAIELMADGYAPQQTTLRLDRRKTRVVYTLLETGHLSASTPPKR